MYVKNYLQTWVGPFGGNKFQPQVRDTEPNPVQVKAKSLTEFSNVYTVKVQPLHLQLVNI